MKLKLLLLSLAICINQNSLAETRIKMASPEDSENYLFKNSLEKIKPQVYRYWYETRYNEDISDEYGLLYEKGQYTRTLAEINCKEKTKKTISITTYNQDGRTVKTSTKKADEITPNYIVPDSYGDEDRKQICKIGEAK